MTKQKINDILQKKILDFACGSGRILKDMQILPNEIHGADISKEMLDLAKKNTKIKKLIQIDITRESTNKMKNTYDIITAFRFFLNANISLRNEAFFHLSLLLQKGGVLIFNNHANTTSIAGIYKIWVKIKKKNICRTMSYRYIKKMADRYGFTVKRVYNYGFLPRIFYFGFGKRVYWKIDNLLAKIPVIKYLGSHQLYICKKR